MKVKPSAGRLAYWLCTLALVLSTQAAQALPEWQINPNGTGVGGATTVSSLNVGGSGFVQFLPDASNPYAFTFVEHGAYQVLKSGGGGPFGTSDLTVTYSVTGRGSFLDFAALRFTSGTINLYSDSVFDFATAASSYGADNGTHVASFNVFDGHVTTAGMVAVDAKLVSLLPGYLFAADGGDLSGRNNVLMELGVFNERISSNPLLVSELACGMAAYTGPGCDGTSFPDSELAYFVHDGGSVVITSVPEPATVGLMLVGLGLISFVAKRRRQTTY